MSDTNERDAFTKWAERQYRNYDAYSMRDYQMGFDAWQARAALAASPVPACRVVDRGFRWVSDAQHHVPQLVIEFEPVPANAPCDAKGWRDRDQLAAMLSAPTMLNGLTESETLATASVAGLSAPAQQAGASKVCTQLNMAVVDAIADDGCRNAAGGIYATRVQEFAIEVQRAFAEKNRLQVRGLTDAPAPAPAQPATEQQAVSARPAAPWPDFLGQTIRQGDQIVHPNGDEGTVLFWRHELIPGDQWRVVYGDGTISRLRLQVGDKGRAVLATTPQEPQAPAQGAEASLDQNELYRLQMAAISTAAFGYWKLGDPIKDEYVTVALKDVASLYEKYDELFKAAAAPAPSVEAQVELTDAQCDRMLRASIPGGSEARDWFLPHETEKGLNNVREVVRRMVATLKEPQQ